MTNANMSTDSLVVYRQTQAILDSYFTGMPLSADLSILENSYRLKFKRSLRYRSLGVKSFEDLVNKMGKMVVVLEINNCKLVMSAREVKTRLKGHLKPHVVELLYKHDGEIKFDSFEHFYNRSFYCRLFYHFYGLSNLDHLCEALNDILEVVVNHSGEKVIKLLVKYNLRKRKNWG